MWGAELRARVSALLGAAVQEVLETVRESVTEFEEQRSKTERENQTLRRRVRELQEQLRRDHPGGRRTDTVPAGSRNTAEIYRHRGSQYTFIHTIYHRPGIV